MRRLQQASDLTSKDQQADLEEVNALSSTDRPSGAVDGIPCETGGPQQQTLPELQELLRQADDPVEAAEVLVSHLVAVGFPMPSLYLARGGRLRCLAVLGYTQVYDGMPPSAGVIGRTATTGQAHELRGVAHHDDYLAAGFAVQDEICVPVLLDGTCVGALNVESHGPLPSDGVVVLQHAAALFAGRLGELGGAPVETPAQQLTRLAGRLAELGSKEQVSAYACLAARALAGAQASALVLPSTDGELRVVHADGALASRLADRLTSPALVEMAGWLAAGTSCWTLGSEPGQASSPAHTALGAAEIDSSFLIGLPRAERCSHVHGGFLMVLPEAGQVVRTDTVELLELFAIHLAGCLRTLSAVAALEETAARDPLTGLGHHAAFHTALARRTPPHQARRTLSGLLVLDLDHFKKVNDTEGHLAGDSLLKNAARLLAQDLRAGDRLFRVGGDEFAALITVDSPKLAESLAARLVATARRELPVTVSVGVAIARPGDRPAELFARADAALYRAKRAGRDAYAT